jgi:hypothetical protein
MNTDRLQSESEAEAFFAYLLNNDFPCGVGERVRAARVLERFGAPQASPGWKPLLCPIFARSPGEQVRFLQAFDLFFAEDSREEPPPPPPGQTRLRRPPSARARGEAVWRNKLARRWPWIVVALVLTVAIPYLDVPPHLQQLRHWLSHARTPAPKPVLVPPNGSVPVPNAIGKTPVVDKRPCDGWECIAKGWRPWALAGPAVVLILAGLVALTPGWRRSQLRKRERRRDPPLTWPPVADAPRLDSYRNLLTGAAQVMNKRLAAESDQLDVPATIRETIRAGGFPKIRFRKQQLLPDYLFLIEERSAGDHYAAWWTAVARELRALGVRIDCYYHGTDPRRVHSANSAVQLTVSRLLDLHPSHAVLLLGKSTTLLNPYSGDLASWAAALESRENRAVLTPEASFEWDSTDVVLGRHLTVLPARLRNLPFVLKSFEALTRTPSSVALAESDEMTAVPDAFLGEAGPIDESAAFALRLYFEPAVFEWLCACAVYPDLQWELTIELGRVVDPSGTIFREHSLLQLIRLRWFRSGRIPGLWRVWLVKQMAPDVGRRVRQFLLLNFAANRAPEGTYARDWQDLQIAAQRYTLAPGDAALRTDLEIAMESMPAVDVNRDALLRGLRDEWRAQSASEKLVLVPQRSWRGFLGGRWKWVALAALATALSFVAAYRAEVDYSHDAIAPLPPVNGSKASDAPVFSRVSADPPVVLPGGSTKICWGGANLLPSQITVRSVPTSLLVKLSGTTAAWQAGCVTGSPKSATVYTLLARNSAGEAASATITVPVEPAGLTIANFVFTAATPNTIEAGGKSNICWKTEGIGTVIVIPAGPAPQPPNGCIVVSPGRSTLYTLHGQPLAGLVGSDVTATVALTVGSGLPSSGSANTPAQAPTGIQQAIPPSPRQAANASGLAPPAPSAQPAPIQSPNSATTPNMPPQAPATEIVQPVPLTDFNGGIGPFRFGMTPSQVNALLPVQFGDVTLTSLPVAGEYGRTEVRYFWMYVTQFKCTSAQDSICKPLAVFSSYWGGQTHIVFLFYQGKLSRMSLRLYPDCQTAIQLLRDFANAYKIAPFNSQPAVAFRSKLSNATVEGYINKDQTASFDVFVNGSPEFSGF